MTFLINKNLEDKRRSRLLCPVLQCRHCVREDGELDGPLVWLYLFYLFACLLYGFYTLQAGSGWVTTESAKQVKINISHSEPASVGAGW